MHLAALYIQKKYVAQGFVFVSVLARIKETTFQRADFALQLLMFVPAEKEGHTFIIFFLSIFLSAVVPTVLSKHRQSASRP